MRRIRASRSLAAAAVLIGVAALIPAAVADTVGTGADAADSRSGRAQVRDTANNVLGTVTIQSARNRKLLISGRLTGLTAGFHGFHIHAVGICDPAATDPTTGAPSPFVTAGGHLNPAGAVHGRHAGDLPVLLVAADGATVTVVESDGVTFADIFDADGSAFIIHALPDNLANIPTRYTSSTTGQPGPDAATLATGDSGGRVACGVIRS
jgi:superoxide dismutase, Cu-Zn family